MKRFLGMALGTAMMAALVGPVRADEKEAMAVVDKAIKAMGGEEALGKAKVITWKNVCQVGCASKWAISSVRSRWPAVSWPRGTTLC